MAELHKKGSLLDCDNYRGILIFDHMSKAFTGLLSKVLKPHCVAGIPTEQCGAMQGRGTDLATHVVRTR